MEIPGYTIEKELGAGGMATVYLATQKSFGRKVALKVLSPALLSNSEAAARFVREARIIAGFSHPHIVPVYDVGSHDNLSYMSMDYLTGGDLVQWIKRGLEVEEALQVTEAIASALQYAHSKGYIHRDIKPNNIMFREDHSPVLTDFGISRLLNANDQLTQSGTIVGTPRYMSPEALQGKAIDGRTDIYALGVVFFEMLTREVPYQAEEYMALALKHLGEPIPQLPKRFERFQGFLGKMMAKNPKDRYQSGLEVIKAIRALRSGAAIEAASTPEPSRPNKPGEVEKQVDDVSVKVGDYALTEAREQVQNNRSASVKQAAKALSVHEALNRKADSAQRLKESTIFREEMTSTLFSKKYAFICELTVYTAGNFSMIFSTFSSKLKDWHNERGRNAQAVELRVTTFPAIYPKAISMMDGLYHSGEQFDFLKKCDCRLVLVDIDTGKEELHTPGSA